MERPILLVNFGGPRNLAEIEPFLIELLTDRDLIRTRLPSLLHQILFRRVAKKRTRKIQEDYLHIGGKSPIHETTEALAKELRKRTSLEVLTFHRYLPSTHEASIQAIERCDAAQITVLPLFPQFSYATTGSIARLLSKQLNARTVRKLRWIKSYPSHPAFISAWQSTIASFLKQHHLREEATALLFSAHGLPQSFIEGGDPYEHECEQSVRAIQCLFPSALCKLAYQSKFGRGEWLRPYTPDLCASAKDWLDGRTAVVFVPIAFTSDHIETLFEIESLYVPEIAKLGVQSLRCPALNLSTHWIDALLSILLEENFSATQMLICSGIRH